MSAHTAEQIIIVVTVEMADRSAAVSVELMCIQAGRQIVGRPDLRRVGPGQQRPDGLPAVGGD